MQLFIKLKRYKSAEGCVRIAGSKSIANRILPMIAFSSNNHWIVRRVPLGEDVTLMLQALKKLGAQIQSIFRESSTMDVMIEPILNVGEEQMDLHLGNSGTCMRFLTAMLAVQSKGIIVLDGVERMRERPILDLVSALKEWKNLQGCNVRISFLEKSNYPPLQLKPAGLMGGITQVSGEISSQFLTGLLMAMPFSKKKISVEIKEPFVSKPYINMTLEILKNTFDIVIDICVNQDKTTYTFLNPKGYVGKSLLEYSVETDASSASYFLALGAIAGSGKGVCVEQFPVSKELQGEAEFLDVLIKMGAKVQYKVKDDWLSQVEWKYLKRKPKVCDVSVSRSSLKAVSYNVETMSDTGMTLAIVALFAEGETVITGISNWRYKETDRIVALENELKKVGAQVKSKDDELCITAPKSWKRATIETYNDHRMAMCFSLICLSSVSVTILNPKCVAKTYPYYFEDFQKLCKS